MPSASLLNFEALLRPISEDAPSGASLRLSPTEDAIKEARRSDEELPQGDWEHELKTADWPAVIEIASEALVTEGKDLQIAVWLLEALIKRHGFQGLRDGLRLLWELQDRFWETLYPEIEEEEGEGHDLEFRAAPLEWMNEKLPLAIRQIPLTQRRDGANYSWLQWEESRMVDNLGRRNQEAMQAALSDGKISGEQFDRAVDMTVTEAPDFYAILFEDLEEIWEEYNKLDDLIDEKYGQQGPSLMRFKEVISDCRSLVENILRQSGGLEPLFETPDDDAETETSVAAAGAAPGRPGVISIDPQNRADALRRLAAIATYFRRTEPHSPVSYLVQRAIRWGEMPLEDWLQAVIHDTTTLETVRETLGLKDAAGSDTDEG